MLLKNYFLIYKMIIKKKKNGYSSNRKYIYGSGFIDTLKNIGSYFSQNKELIAKPLLGVVGNLAAAGLTEGGKALLNRLITNKKKPVVQLDAKSQEILQSIINDPIPITNVIGTGARGRNGGARGAGIKKI